MKILFLTPNLPHPPQQGRAIRNFHLLRAAAREHSVDLLSFAGPGQDTGPLAAICRRIECVPQPARSGARRLLGLLGPRPDLVGRLPSPRMAARLEAMLAGEDYDLLQVEGLEVADYGLHQPAATGRLVYDAHNAEHLLQLRLARLDASAPGRWPRAAYSLLQGLKLRAYERRLLERSRHLITCSPADAAVLRGLQPTIPTSVIPNGVDTDTFHPSDRQPRPDSLVFTGTMDFRPNVDGCRWFIEKVLPRLQARRPAVRLSIVGRSPPAELARLARGAPVELTGWVEDVRPHVWQAQVYVVPLRVGGGTRLKVLEAMAMGKAIVTTSMGAEGLELEAGRQAVVADGAAGMADAVADLLERPKARASLGREARALAEERYAWPLVTRPLAGVYQ